MSSSAPVVLFVYNRPEHTRKTLAALAANKLSERTELFIYADGSRPGATKADLIKIEETRSVIREKRWCDKVNIIERNGNFGLAANIINGVTTIVNKYGRVIVLEDDIVTSPEFLVYMNNALELYKNDDSVMHVAGYSFPWIDPAKVGSDTFFYRVPSCWGWATWARAWKHYNDNAPYLFVSLCEKNLLSSFDL
jgi:GT2 family glycosyltransferase